MNNENKMDELDGAQIFSDWANLTGTPQNTAPEKNDEFSLDNLMSSGGEDYWLQKFQETNLTGMDLVAVKLIPAYIHDFAAEQAQLKAQTHAFLTNLATTHLNDLRIAGLSEDQINGLNRGDLPINWTVHLKYPVAYGGVITPDNLVLIPHHPFHESLHHFINQQTITDAGVMTPDTLYIPVPKTSVYVPFGTQEMATTITHFETMGAK